MTTYDSHNEDFIRRMVKHTRLQKPSDDFTSRVMEGVLLDAAPVKSWIGNIYWFIIAGAAAVAVLMMIFPAWTFFDLDFSTGSASPEQFAGLLNAVTSMMSGFTALFSSLKGGSVIILVSIALGLLVTIDQLLRRSSPDKHFMF
jgi:hypothetical protein